MVRQGENKEDHLSGSERTAKARKNILAGAVLKGVDVATYLLLVPLLLGYLNAYEYGIWLTLSSILAWVDSLDIGLGNGMRNRVAEAMANGERKTAHAYVSTGFISLALIMGGLIIIGTAISPLIDWYSLIGADPASVPGLDKIVYIAFCIFCLNMIFKCVGNLFMAMQLPAINTLLVTTGHLLALAIIYVLTLTTRGNLLLVAVIYSASPLVVYLLANILTFTKIYRFLTPSLKYFRKEYIVNLLAIGGQFFILQVSGILLFSFVNLLISHRFGPAEVTPYNIAYRYYSLVLLVMNIILTPLWSASTDAYTRGDLQWISKTVRRLLAIIGILLLLLIPMTLLSGFVYRIWINDMVSIPYLMSILIASYVAILMVSLTFSNILNGMGKLRVQIINTTTMAVLFYPVCSLLAGIWGIYGIIAGMCLLNITGLVFNIVQFRKILKGTATGIWSK